MAKLNLTPSEFEMLTTNLKIIDHELNWINSLADNENNNWFKGNRKRQLEAQREAIYMKFDKSIKRSEPKQPPKITLPDFLKGRSKAEIVFFLYEKWNRLANENDEEYKEYYRAFAEKEKELSEQERAEYEKLLYNRWVKDFLKR